MLMVMEMAADIRRHGWDLLNMFDQGECYRKNNAIFLDIVSLNTEAWLRTHQNPWIGKP